MNSEFAKAALARLAPRETEVLRLRCQGLAYAEIGITLQPPIKENTVKSVMSHVYTKLELLDLTKAQRWEALFQFYCPVLKEEWIVLPPESGQGELEPPRQVAGSVVADGPQAENETIPASSRAFILVAQDEGFGPTDPPQLPGNVQRPGLPAGAIGRLPPPPQDPGPPAKRGRPGCLIVTLLSVLLAIAAFFVWQFLQGQATTPATRTPTSVPTTPGAPTKPAATGTPALATVIVVVTATLPPATDTPPSSATPVPATNTPAPSDTALPTATPTVAISLPFSDNFDSGWDTAWQWTAGSWATKDGALTALPGEPSSYIWFYLETDWTDFRVTIRVDSTGFGVPLRYPAAIAVRYTPGDANPLAFLCDTWNCGWGRPSGSDSHYLQGTGPTIQTPMSLKIEVRGNSVSAFIDDAEYQSYTLTDLPASGGLAIGTRCPSVAGSCPLFDNLEIEPLAP